MADLDSAVAELIHEVGAYVAAEQHRIDADGFVSHKAGDEIVTDADRAAEARLIEGLALISPEAVAVGEEGVSADPTLLERLHGDDSLWIIDPIDGTGNYAAGRSTYGILLAKVEHREVVASWIWRADTGTLYAARDGEVRAGDTRIQPRPAMAVPNGAVLTKFLSAELQAAVVENVDAYVPQRASSSAAIEYGRLLDGDLDFVVYYRTRPWDHAAGAFALRCCDGAAERFDGSPYRHTDETSGLISVRSAPVAAYVRTQVLGLPADAEG